MSKQKKIKTIGLIVEDNSDFYSLKTLISRLVKKDNIVFKKTIGNGCGRIRRKAVSYANILTSKGCDLIILVHDLDRNALSVLRKDLWELLKSCTNKNKFICIPIEELEGWFLADPEGIKNALKLDKTPKIRGNPESFCSPKEKLGDFVYSCSGHTKIYLNTKHNVLLSDKLDLRKLSSKCGSFRELEQFVMQFQY